MKIYPTLDATLHVQSYGSTFLMVVKGKEEDMELMFNGLYNLGATNDGTMGRPIELDYTDESRTVASFWSSPEKMLRFFFNLYIFRHLDEAETKLHRKNNGWKRHKGGMRTDAVAYAKEQLALLKKHSSISFTPHQKDVFVPTYSQGIISAERPDDDFKDAVLQNAFRDRNHAGQNEMMLGNIQAE